MYDEMFLVLGKCEIVIGFGFFVKLMLLSGHNWTIECAVWFYLFEMFKSF